MSCGSSNFSFGKNHPTDFHSDYINLYLWQQWIMTTLVLIFFDDNHSGWYERYCKFVLIYISLIASNIEHLKMIIGHLCLFFEKCQFSSFFCCCCWVAVLFPCKKMDEVRMHNISEVTQSQKKNKPNVLPHMWNLTYCIHIYVNKRICWCNITRKIKHEWMRKKRI